MASRRARLRRIAVEHVQPHAGLHRDDREAVADAVVEVLCHPQLLLGGGAVLAVLDRCAPDPRAGTDSRGGRDQRAAAEGLPQADVDDVLAQTPRQEAGPDEDAGAEDRGQPLSDLERERRQQGGHGMVRKIGPLSPPIAK